MEKFGVDLDGGSPVEGQNTNRQEARKLSIQRCIHSLVHACECRDPNCRLPRCQKMKRVTHHKKICRRNSNGGCFICKQFLALCVYHARHCPEKKCPVPFCLNIKLKIKQQQSQHGSQQVQLLRRRIAAMNATAKPTSTPSNQAASLLKTFFGQTKLQEAQLIRRMAAMNIRAKSISTPNIYRNQAANPVTTRRLQQELSILHLLGAIDLKPATQKPPLRSTL